MAKARNINGTVQIWCPGCEDHHELLIKKDGDKRGWTFNGNMDKPTFQPSLLVTRGHYVQGQPQPPECPQCTYKDDDGNPWPWGCGRCHSFIRDGMIEFLTDSTHALAGKTVPLGDLDAAL